MKSYLQTGDRGDLIYTLPAIRSLGGGILYLCDRPFVKQFSGRAYDEMLPLLKLQPYLTDVRWHAGEPVDYDFTNFRTMYKPSRSLAMTQAVYIGADPGGSQTKWLHVPNVSKNGRVIVHRSPRYHNELFPWAEVVEYFGRKVLYCGLWDEFMEFVSENGHCEFYQPRDYLELAELIAGADLFIGNQSSPYAVAEGLKVNSIQETSERNPDCMFNRPNAKFIQGDVIELIEAKGKRVRLQSPQHYFHSINATRPVPIGEARHVKFELTKQFAGAWSGIYATNNKREIRALRANAQYGVGEITKERYEAERMGKAA